MSENRTPAGVPTGGQFAATRHAEADVDLAGGDPRAYDGDDVDAHAAKHSWTPRDWEKYFEERCDTEGCGNRLDDGEGCDRLCGECADAIEAQDEQDQANRYCDELSGQVVGGQANLDEAIGAYHTDNGHWLSEGESRHGLTSRAAQLRVPDT